MEQAAVRDQASWDQVANNFDLLFSRVDDILDTQIKLEAQYDMTNKVVEQMMKDQQLLAKQIENTGQAVARLTLDSTRRPFREPDSPTASEASAENPFHRNHQGTSPIIPPLRRGHGGLRSGVEGSQKFKPPVPKLPFPRFDGTNPTIWKSKCLDYFSLYDVPDAMKATFASLHIEDNAAKWLQVYKRQYGLADWQSFIDVVVEKFGASDYRDAMEELLDLTQTSTVEQYATAFENLKYEICMHNEGFGELFFVSQFVKGLKYEIGAVVQSQLPQTVDRAIMLAKVQQHVLEKGKGRQQKSLLPPRRQSWSAKQDAKSSAPSPTLSKERQLLNYRKSNNLCYYCGEKYDPTHAAICTQRPKAQVNAIVVNDLDMPLSEEVVAQLELEDSLTDEFGQLSLNALAGTDQGQTLKLRALVKNKVMLTLVDSGSTHSFVSSQFLQQVGITPIPTSPTSVRLANGQVLVSDHWVPQLHWWCDGYTLHTDMKVLDIGAFDAILGFDWLKQNSPMTCDWEHKTLQFQQGKTEIKLQGISLRQTEVTHLPADKVYKWWKGNDILALVLLALGDQSVPTNVD